MVAHGHPTDTVTLGTFLCGFFSCRCPSLFSKTKKDGVVGGDYLESFFSDTFVMLSQSG